MSVEHEAKFALDDRAALEARLRRGGRLRTPWHFESNTVYDRDGELGRARRLSAGRLCLCQRLRALSAFPRPHGPGCSACAAACS